MKLVKNLLSGLANILYPKTCLGCKIKIAPASEIEHICHSCWSKIKLNIPPFCHSCGRSLLLKKSIKNICLECIKSPLGFDRAFSACLYEGVIREVIHTFKYKARDYLGKILAQPMIEFIREYNLPIKYMDVIIPVPLHNAKLRQREFNQAAILAKHIAEEFNKPTGENLLLRHKNTRTQAELSGEERLNNVKGVFSLEKNADIAAKNVLLIDDVFTTGATVSEAAFVLKKSGANIVYVLTLAN